MMRLLRATALVLGVLGASSVAQAQGPAPVGYFSGAGSVYGAPGFYGTSWGVASYGVPRTYSVFNSPYGAGYGYGYAPPQLVPGYYGMTLWRPGFSVPGYVYGSPYGYQTFPVRTWPNPAGWGPPFGAYAPGFGPAPVPVRELR